MIVRVQVDMWRDFSFVVGADGVFVLFAVTVDKRQNVSDSFGFSVDLHDVRNAVVFQLQKASFLIIIALQRAIATIFLIDLLDLATL